MKSFAKLGLLLALVVAGRYFRPTEYAARLDQETALVKLAKPDTLHFATYNATQISPVTPANQRSSKIKALANNDNYSTWY